MITNKSDYRKPKKRWFRRVWVYIVGILLLLGVILTVQFSIDNRNAYDRLLHDFPMWLSTKYFGFALKSMMCSEISSNFYDTMLPVEPRLKGILADENVTNIDMNVNFDDYPVEKITSPILVVHAKDDPMAKYAETEKFIARTHPETAIFEDGGHLITGHGDAVPVKIREFISQTK